MKLDNTIIRFSLLLFLATLLLSCRRQQEQGPLTAEQIEQKARAFLQPSLHLGDSTTNLIAHFGSPVYQYETNHQLIMDFIFRDQDHAALMAGVGGFVGIFTNNQLVAWVPIYESRNPPFDSSPIKHPSVMFRSDHPVLTFHLVSDEQKNGFVYIDSAAFKSLGYINKSPDLAVQSGQYILFDSATKSTHSLELLLVQEDADKLKMLTSQNIGKKVAVLVGSQVVLAPYIRSPISDGQLILELPDSSYSILSEALRLAAIQ